MSLHIRFIFWGKWRYSLKLDQSPGSTVVRSIKLMAFEQNLLASGVFWFCFLLIFNFFFYWGFISLEPIFNIFLEMTSVLPYGIPDFKPLWGACVSFRVPGRNEWKLYSQFYLLPSSVGREMGMLWSKFCWRDCMLISEPPS